MTTTVVRKRGKPANTEDKKPSHKDMVLKLRSVSFLMGMETDALNNAIEDAQKFFLELDLGVAATVRLETTGHPNTYDYEYRDLCFQKQGGSWMFVVEIGDGQSYPDTTALLNTSRRVRELAATKIPEMLVALHDAATKKVETVKAAHMGLRAFLAEARDDGGEE